MEKAKPLTVTGVELDGPKASEVLVEVKATGICHTHEFTLCGRTDVPKSSTGTVRTRC